MITRLARRYAQAFYDSCLEEKNVEAVYDEIAQLREAIDHIPDFKRFLKNPTLSSKERKEALEAILAHGLFKTVYRFLLFLEAGNRLYLLGEICEYFEDLYLHWHRIIKATITSHRELSEGEVRLICQNLKERFQSEINPKLIVKPDILGGIKIQIGDRVYDYSLQHQLIRFKESLIFA